MERVASISSQIFNLVYKLTEPHNCDNPASESFYFPGPARVICFQRIFPEDCRRENVNAMSERKDGLRYHYKPYSTVLCLLVFFFQKVF